ncbi:MAG: hypothetical protein ACREJ3_01415 [Polyangiaceae bacterium]
MRATADAILDALWERTLSAWEDDAAHDALLEHALRSDLLPDLAGRYRALADDPNKGPIAKMRLDAILAAATSLLSSMKTPRTGKVPLSMTLSVLAICLVLLGWLALALYGDQSF